jgi:hypothetical protein
MMNLLANARQELFTWSILCHVVSHGGRWKNPWLRFLAGELKNFSLGEEIGEL